VRITPEIIESDDVQSSNRSNRNNRGNGIKGANGGIYSKSWAEPKKKEDLASPRTELIPKQVIQKSDFFKSDKVQLGIRLEKIELAPLETELKNSNQWITQEDITHIKLDLFLNNNQGPNLNVWAKTIHGSVLEMVARLQDNKKAFVGNLNDRYTDWNLYPCYMDLKYKLEDFKNVQKEQPDLKAFIAGKLRNKRGKNTKGKGCEPMNPFMTAYLYEFEDEFQLGCYIHGLEITRTVSKKSMELELEAWAQKQIDKGVTGKEFEKALKARPTASVYVSKSESDWGTI